jgi:hypothetical protein
VVFHSPASSQESTGGYGAEHSASVTAEDLLKDDLRLRFQAMSLCNVECTWLILVNRENFAK